MATSNTLVCITIPAAADLSAKQFRGINYNGAVSGLGDHCVGVLQNKPVSGDAAQVAISGVTKAVAGAAVAAGAKLMTDANGKFITAVASASRHVVGIAMEAAAADGVVFEVLLIAKPVLA